MLTADQIEDYLDSYDVEGKTLELKQRVPSTDASKRTFAKVVVAFANTEGGDLIIGADDEKSVDSPRSVYDVCPPGQQDEVIRTVRQIIESRTEPSIRHRVDLDAAYLPSRGVTVLQVSVDPPRETDPLCYLRDRGRFAPYLREEKRCVPMKPDEIARFQKRLVEEEAKRKAEELSAAVDRTVDHVLTVLAARILALGGLAPEQVFESALLEGCQGNEDVRDRARKRLNNHPLLRRIEGEYDFPNERLRAYYAARDLAQRQVEELLELLNNPRYDQVWPHVFTHLVNRQVAETLLNDMIQAEQIERALHCYYVRRNREVGQISERLTSELLRQARRALAESTDLQALFISNMLKDPYADVRRFVLRRFDPAEYPDISPPTMVEALLERVQLDPNQNCQAAAAEALLQIEIPDDYHWSVAERALSKIESLTTGDDFDVAENAERWVPLVELLGKIGSSQIMAEKLTELGQRISETEEIPPRDKEEWIGVIEEAHITVQSRVASGDNVQVDC